jgi:hypothetical protein
LRLDNLESWVPNIIGITVRNVLINEIEFPICYWDSPNSTFFYYELLLMEYAAIRTGTTFWKFFADFGLEAFMFIVKQKANRRN